MLNRLAYSAALFLIPSMVMQLVFPISSLTSLKVLLVFFALVVAVTPGWIRVSGKFALHLVMFWYFISIAVFQKTWELNSIVRLDVIIACETLLAVPVLVAFLDTRGWTRRYVPDTGRLLVFVGIVAASAGLAKFYLMSRGIMIQRLYLADGRYPPGTALQVDYNSAALGLIVSLAAAFWLRSQTGVSRLWRAACGAAIPLLTLVVLFSSSRRGLVFLVVVFLTQAFHRGRSASRRRWPVRAAVVPLLVVALVVLVFVGVRSQEDNVVVSAMRSIFDVDAATARIVAIGSTTDLTQSRAPSLGYAWTEFSRRYTPSQALFGRGSSYLREMSGVDGGLEYPHSFVLSSLLHGGLVLTALMLFLVVGAMRTYWTARREYGALAWAFAYCLVFGLSSSNSIYSTELLYFLTVVAAIPGALLPRTDGSLLDEDGERSLAPAESVR